MKQRNERSVSRKREKRDGQRLSKKSWVLRFFRNRNRLLCSPYYICILSLTLNKHLSEKLQPLQSSHITPARSAAARICRFYCFHRSEYRGGNVSPCCQTEKNTLEFKTSEEECFPSEEGSPPQFQPPRKKRRLNSKEPHAINSLVSPKDDKEDLPHKTPKPQRTTLSTSQRIKILLDTSFTQYSHPNATREENGLETAEDCQRWRVGFSSFFV